MGSKLGVMPRRLSIARRPILGSIALPLLLALAPGCRSDVSESSRETEATEHSVADTGHSVRNEGIAAAGIGGAQAAASDPGAASHASDSKPPVHGYEIVAEYPHDPRAYTQGLVIVDGELFESTGQRGESTLRRVDLKTGKPKRTRPLAKNLFGEGLAATGGLLVQLTWTSHKALVWDRKRLVQLSYSHDYKGEGWGLTTNSDGMFVMSDGTDELRIIEPKTFKVIETVDVTAQGRPVRDLNELEWIDGEIWANVWKSDRIARIDPTTGKVRSWVDLKGLLPPGTVPDPDVDNVLNGIAYDEDKDAIYVTGKRWPKLFEIRVVE